MLDILTPGFMPTPVPYPDGWALQRRVHADVVSGARPDTLILLEHAAVYTAGKRTEDHERPQDGTPVIDVDRGGKITWHGPGQLVGYPIFRLPEPMDVVAHVRRLERILIEVLRPFGVDGHPGEEIVRSKNGLLTTVGYKLGDQPTHYALEGSIAVTGSLIQWLRDQLGIISSAPEVEELAEKVEDNGGVYIVPAFSGLFAPYWRPDARGAIVGLTRYANKNHIARAALEAVAFQTRDVLDAVNADAGVDLSELKVDGGMVANDALMQFQADILGVPVVRPVVAETTALGAAYAAGLAVGFWSGLDDLSANWQEDRRWEPTLDEAERDRQLRLWRKAVTKSMDWVDDDVR